MLGVGLSLTALLTQGSCVRTGRDGRDVELGVGNFIVLAFLGKKQVDDCEEKLHHLSSGLWMLVFLLPFVLFAASLGAFQSLCSPSMEDRRVPTLWT